jgi:hypothetical protein
MWNHYLGSILLAGITHELAEETDDCLVSQDDPAVSKY